MSIPDEQSYASPLLIRLYKPFRGGDHYILGGLGFYWEYYISNSGPPQLFFPNPHGKILYISHKNLIYFQLC